MEEGVVAITCEEGSHIRRWPSKLADNILSWPGGVSFERTSTELTQSSCSNEATCRGGMRARTYSRASDVSAEMPLAVRYSSRLVRRYVPLTRNSRGVGFSDWSSPFTRVERAYLRKFVGTRMCPVLSGRESSASRVERDILTCVAGSVCAIFAAMQQRPVLFWPVGLQCFESVCAVEKSPGSTVRNLTPGARN